MGINKGFAMQNMPKKSPRSLWSISSETHPAPRRNWAPSLPTAFPNHSQAIPPERKFLIAKRSETI